MSGTVPKITPLHQTDVVWSKILQEAKDLLKQEPLMASFVHAVILNHKTLEDALAGRLANKLASNEMPASLLRDMFGDAFESDPNLGASARADILAVCDRDPACNQYLQPVLYFKGFQALQASRVANWLWRQDRKEIASFLQMRSSEIFGVDIHPGATIGKGILIDHATSVVIGETAVVADDVSMLHSVTLGGTGKEGGDRHPKIGYGVLIGAGAKVLGNIKIGRCSRIGAGSVVLQDVPECKTVAGVPAKIVGDAGCSEPSVSMNHILDCND